MKPEYNFSKGKRGKFYRPDAVLNIPIYLDPDVELVIRGMAERTGQDVESLVNDWLRSNIHIIRSVEPAANP